MRCLALVGAILSLSAAPGCAHPNRDAVKLPLVLPPEDVAAPQAGASNGPRRPRPRTARIMIVGRASRRCAVADQPVRGVLVSLLADEGAQTVARTRSDDDGTFHLDVEAPVDGALPWIQAVELRQRLPRGAEHGYEVNVILPCPGSGGDSSAEPKLVIGARTIAAPAFADPWHNAGVAVPGSPNDPLKTGRRLIPAADGSDP